MGTVLIEHCPDCHAMVGQGHLYEHQQKHCQKRQAVACTTDHPRGPVAYYCVQCRTQITPGEPGEPR